MSYPGRGRTSHRVRRIGGLDLPGGGQVVVEDAYAFVGHMKPPHGTSIIDVRDPRNPRLVGEIRLPDAASHTHKVRVVGDLMIVNVEQDQRHFKRKAAGLPEVEAQLATELGRAPTDAEIATRMKVAAGEDVARMRRVLREPPYQSGGFRIYDISDRANPRLVSETRTSGFGVHRFDADARHAYISTEMEGYVGNILVVYDIADPRRPQEVARWWMPGQHIAGGETPTWSGYRNRLHHAMRVGEELWAAVWHAGIRVIDCSDIANLKTIGSYRFPAAIPEPTHTVMPFARTVDGRRYAAAIDEEHEHVHGRLHGFLWILDVTDLSAIEPVAAFDVSELDSPYARAGGRFGAHQYHERLDDGLVYATWFAGGLRIVDARDPLAPEEVGHFIPEPRGDAAAPQSNDVAVDENGLIYLIDRVRGFDVLEFDRP